ncbi:hypothetical protein [Staphylococcus xylosus]|uniref:hypothetical protein n=1 Tax=Staphylococcus xylosus TaxID=1288 RepID=UPI0015FA0724|nr:hypothetical protein [Staphylococcus xylosus]
MKWFLLIVQVILGVVLAFSAYKQMNQDHLDTWFSVYIVLFIIFVVWYAKHYDKS